MTRRAAAGAAGAAALRPQSRRALRRGGAAVRRRRAGAGQAGLQAAGRRLAGDGADVRDRGAAAHPDALLHRAGRARGADIGVLRHGADRALLSADLRARLRGHGAGRAGHDPRGGPGRQHGRAAARRAARRHAVPRLHRRGGVRDHSRRGGRAHALRARRRCRTTSGSTWCAGATPIRESSSGSPGSRRWRSASSRWRWGSRSRGRTSPSWCRSRSPSRRARTFPRSILAIFWRGYTTAGAVTSMVAGTVVTLVLIYLSPTIQVDILGHEAPGSRSRTRRW